MFLTAHNLAAGTLIAKPDHTEVTQRGEITQRGEVTQRSLAAGTLIAKPTLEVLSTDQAGVDINPGQGDGA